MAAAQPVLVAMSGVIDVTDFLRRKLAWHRHVMCDDQLTELAKTIASLLLHDFDWRQVEGDAYRSQAGLADLASCSVRAVQGSLEQLERRGLLEIITARGRGKTNRYRFLDQRSDASGHPEKANAASPQAGEKANAASPQAGEKANAASPLDAENTNAGSEKDERGFAQTLLENPNPLNPPSPATCERRSLDEGERRSHVGESEPSGFAGRWLSVPPEIRQEIAANPQYGEGWAIAWIDPCVFDPATRQIHARSNFARSRLLEHLRKRLPAWNVTLGEPVPLARSSRPS